MSALLRVGIGGDKEFGETGLPLTTRPPPCPSRPDGIRTRDPVLDDCSFTGIRRMDIVLTANERQWTRIRRAEKAFGGGIMPRFRCGTFALIGVHWRLKDEKVVR